MTTLAISGDILARHPETLVGGLLASNLVAAAGTVGRQPFPDDTDLALVNQDVTLELVADHLLIRDWRAAIVACGLKPSTHKPRPERLARQVMKHGLVRTGLPLVDLCCEVAARHLASVGGFDLGRLPSPPAVELRLARPGTDTFVPVGGDDVALTERVAVYAAGSKVLCWAYNGRESRETCLTEDSDTALFLGEAVSARQHEALHTALIDLAGRLTAAGAGVGPLTYLDGEQPEAAIASG